ncbi:MAG: hypothetical protein BGO54_17285 [Sphingobacteriales bacterium 46-32]|nr:MAG: hypothetical protein BGO54_17285 [Sphingobacteriales bacterium 46-32]
MSWLSKLFTGNKRLNEMKVETPQPDIPEEVFIEKNEPNNTAEVLDEEYNAQNNIYMVYNFLSKDYQQSGYEDALAHPDTSYRNEKIKEIQGELGIIVDKAKTFYEDAIRELDFLIESRNRIGMVDVVDELKMRKEKADDHYRKIIEIQKQAIDLGESHRLVISYKRGFQNGMAAIAIHESNKRKF